MKSSGRRSKASDVFRETTFLFGKKATFDEAFPDIDDFLIEIEIGHSAHGNRRLVFTRANAPGEYIDCDNSLCYNGGFSIGQVLRSMVSARETDRQRSDICRGYEGSPKGRRKYRDCLNFYQYKVHIDYKT